MNEENDAMENTASGPVAQRGNQVEVEVRIGHGGCGARASEDVDIAAG